MSEAYLLKNCAVRMTTRVIAGHLENNVIDGCMRLWDLRF